MHPILSCSSYHPLPKASVSISIISVLACAILAILVSKGILFQNIHSNLLPYGFVGGAFVSLVIVGVSLYFGRKKTSTINPTGENKNDQNPLPIIKQSSVVPHDQQVTDETSYKEFLSTPKKIHKLLTHLTQNI